MCLFGSKSELQAAKRVSVGNVQSDDVKMADSTFDSAGAMGAFFDSKGYQATGSTSEPVSSAPRMGM